MVQRTRPEDDDWQTVKDAKKRKQIQDRRLREAKRSESSVQQSSTQHSSRTSDNDSSPIGCVQNVSELAVIDSISNSTYTSSLEALDSTTPHWQIIDLDLPELASDPNDTILSDPDLLPNNLHLPLPSPEALQLQLPLNVFTALFMNGQILSLACGTLLASKSPPANPSIPVPLRPTASQQLTVHFQWIDRLPFPKLRDSLIRLQGVVDLEEFLNDIFVLPSFKIRAGAACWDPRAWSMEAGWARKWGWLFF
ncbi:hypothetical protein ST47_g7815 [Ascochyta rabiei]|uniref:Uncharacterized protein n=1 Tax=Didymella rabiei TaxID=5454 RepID=A0A163A655_DIDRA|nr:hypothetical protein ST47_g7815 [Ascochyta rabiei]